MAHNLYLVLFRNLANHRVRVAVCVPQKLVELHSKMPLLSTEMKLLKLTDAKIVNSINGKLLSFVVLVVTKRI